MSNSNNNKPTSAPVTERPTKQHPMANIISEIDGKINLTGIDTVCVACHRTISDRYIMRVMDNSWHESCLQCSVCHLQLTRSCYSRDCKLYCKVDYDKLFATKCSACLIPIPPTALVMRVLDNIYHLDCFTCISCGRQLEKGDQFVIRSGRLFCRPDFEKEMALIHLSGANTSESAIVPSCHGQNSPIQAASCSLSTGMGNSSSSSNCPSDRVTPVGGGISAPSTVPPPQPPQPPPRQDGRRGPKRPRTILTTAQRRAFKASFETSPKPCRKVREHLAKETGLSVRIVQVWFQNQRAKLKKIQRKQQQLQQHQGQSGLSSTSNQETSSQNSTRTQGTGHLTDSSPDSPSNYSMSQLRYLTQSPMDDDASYYSPHGGEGAGSGVGFSKADLGMDDSESSLNGLDDVLTTGHDDVPPHHIHHHPPNHIPDHVQGHHSGHGGSFQGPSMTPIDKLYSMQSSYFNSNECDCLTGSN